MSISTAFVVVSRVGSLGIIGVFPLKHLNNSDTKDMEVYVKRLDKNQHNRISNPVPKPNEEGNQ